MDLMLRIPPFRRSFSQREFSTWYNMVKDYIVAKQIATPMEKLATMRVIGGIELVELLQILAEQPDNMASSSVLEVNPFEKVLIALERHFKEVANPMQERYLFRELKQKPGEKTREYTIRLKEQARKCQFENMEKEIFDQLAIGTTDKALQKKAFSGKITSLEKALKIASTNESFSEWSLYKD